MTQIPGNVNTDQGQSHVPTSSSAQNMSGRVGQTDLRSAFPLLTMASIAIAAGLVGHLVTRSSAMQNLVAPSAWSQRLSPDRGSSPQNLENTCLSNSQCCDSSCAELQSRPYPDSRISAIRVGTGPFVGRDLRLLPSRRWIYPPPAIR